MDRPIPQVCHEIGLLNDQVMQPPLLSGSIGNNVFGRKIDVTIGRRFHLPPNLVGRHAIDDLIGVRGGGE